MRESSTFKLLKEMLLPASYVEEKNNFNPFRTTVKISYIWTIVWLSLEHRDEQH